MQKKLVKNILSGDIDNINAAEEEFFIKIKSDKDYLNQAKN